MSKEMQVDIREVKKLAIKIADTFKGHFPDSKNRDEIARQMLTSLAALSMTSQIVKDEAEELGFTMDVMVGKIPDFESSDDVVN